MSDRQLNAGFFDRKGGGVNAIGNEKVCVSDRKLHVVVSGRKQNMGGSDGKHNVGGPDYETFGFAARY